MNFCSVPESPWRTAGFRIGIIGKPLVEKWQTDWSDAVQYIGLTSRRPAGTIWLVPRRRRIPWRIRTTGFLFDGLSASLLGMGRFAPPLVGLRFAWMQSRIGPLLLCQNSLHNIHYVSPIKMPTRRIHRTTRGPPSPSWRATRHTRDESNARPMGRSCLAR